MMNRYKYDERCLGCGGITNISTKVISYEPYLSLKDTELGDFIFCTECECTAQITWTTSGHKMVKWCTYLCTACQTRLDLAWQYIRKQVIQTVHTEEIRCSDIDEPFDEDEQRDIQFAINRINKVQWI